MPFSSVAELKSRIHAFKNVPDSLLHGALSAFNKAWHAATGGKEAKDIAGIRAAWGAIKKVAHKEGGKWVRNEDTDTMLLEEEYVFDDVDLAAVGSSGVELGGYVTLEQVLDLFNKPFFLKRPLVIIRGGLSTRGGTKGDWDIGICYPTRIAERDFPLEFRIGRQIPSEFHHKVKFPFTQEHNYENFGGPFTSYTPLYDLLVVPSKYRETIRMEKLQEFFEFNARLSEITDESAIEIESQRYTSAIKPLQFVLPVKPTIGHQPTAHYSIDELLALIKDGPWAVEKKYDGCWLLLAKSGDKVKIWSEKSIDVTNRLPSTVKEMQSWNINDVTVVSDTERWTSKGEYIGRENVAAYLHGQDEVNDEGIVHNIFDVIYYDKDIHMLPLTERLKYKARLPIDQSTRDAPSIKSAFNIAPTIISSESKDVKRAVQIVQKAEGSEGAVIKSLESQYPLNGIGNRWWKIKTTLDLNVVVLKVIPTRAEGTYNYRVGVTIPENWEVLNLSKVGTKTFMDVGKTMNLKSSPLNIGDIITISYEELFYYQDPDTGTKQLTVYVANIVDPTPDTASPNTADEALIQSEKAGLLRKKTGKLSFWRKEFERIAVY